jgi:acyl-CoA synthetase (AMP-forming)/AMP-acid ligase II/peptidoglycan/LPS O-acetylase OafA/YrhL
MAGRRLDQVDAMRPIKQAGVIGTHSIMYVAPAAASVSSGAALLLFHVSREGFFFISACMLTYAYADLHRDGLRRFYARRCVSVLIPYLCWTVIYFLYLLPRAHYASASAALKHLASMTYDGFYQLYFLLVIMQFYLVFPLVLMLLRRTRGHHGLVIAVAVAAQVAIAILTFWNKLPAWLSENQQRDALSYLLYLIGGGVVAFHLEEVDRWVRGHARPIMALTVAAGLAAEGIYFLARYRVTTALGSGSDPFQPSVIAFNVGAIACGYLAGVALVRPGRSRRTQAVVRSGSDNAYGIYLTQMLFITTLVWLGWPRLTATVPWPLLCLITVGIVFGCGATLTALLARTPLAVPLTGRPRQPWSTLIPRRHTKMRTVTLISEWIEAAATHRDDAPYLEDAAGTRTLTYGGLQRVVQAWARRLDDAGVPPGAAVAVRVPDPLGYATALVAILAAGRVVIPLDPAAPAAEISRVLAVARPAAAVSDSGRDLPPGLAVLSPRDDAGLAVATPTVASDSGGIFLCTSGTTGTPKGILLRDGQLGHVAASVARHHRLTPADRGYCCLPLFHVNAEVVGLLATLAAGASLVLDRKFSRRGFWDLIHERRITWINAVPAIITVLAMDPSAARSSGRVRFVRSASAPLPPSTLRRFEDAFGIPVVETYGMTEAASMITANPLDGPRKAGSAGLPVGTEVRVVPAMTVGRVQIRGRGVIKEYAEGGAAGAVDSEGWLDTGDLGHLDADGYLFLAGRSDDVINRGGEKIYPREIEDFLLAQPGVWSAAVVAATDEVLGELPVAYVVPAGPWRGYEMADMLREACAAELPRPKRPSAFYLVQELPLGPTGKLARRRLRELATAPGG